MKRHIPVSIVAVLLGVLATSAGSCQAASWIFGPPIYKQPRPPVAVQPQADRGPYYSEPQGEYTGTSMRFLNSMITIQGRTVDDYMVRQSYVQHGTEDE